MLLPYAVIFRLPGIVTLQSSLAVVLTLKWKTNSL